MSLFEVSLMELGTGRETFSNMVLVFATICFAKVSYSYFKEK